MISFAVSSTSGDDNGYDTSYVRCKVIAANKCVRLLCEPPAQRWSTAQDSDMLNDVTGNFLVDSGCLLVVYITFWLKGKLTSVARSGSACCANNGAAGTSTVREVCCWVRPYRSWQDGSGQLCYAMLCHTNTWAITRAVNACHTEPHRTHDPHAAQADSLEATTVQTS